MEESNSFCRRNRLNIALQFGGYCSEDYVKLNSVSQLGEKTKQKQKQTTTYCENIFNYSTQAMEILYFPWNKIILKSPERMF